jgi:hypothetical protein
MNYITRRRAASPWNFIRGPIFLRSGESFYLAALISLAGMAAIIGLTFPHLVGRSGSE